MPLFLEVLFHSVEASDSRGAALLVPARTTREVLGPGSGVPGSGVWVWAVPACRHPAGPMAQAWASGGEPREPWRAGPASWERPTPRPGPAMPRGTCFCDGIVEIFLRYAFYLFLIFFICLTIQENHSFICIWTIRSPDYCIKWYTPMHERFQRWDLKREAEAIPEDGEIEVNLEYELEQERARAKSEKWVPKVRAPKPTSECAACWKMVRITWKDKGGYRMLRGPEPPPHQNLNARMCQMCKQAIMDIETNHQLGVEADVEQLDDYEMRHVQEYRPTLQCYRTLLQTKYREMWTLALKYAQMQRAVKRSNRKAIRATHLVLLRLKQMYSRLPNRQGYDQDTILDLNGTQAMDDKEIFHLASPLGTLIRDKYEFIRERCAAATKHEEIGNSLKVGSGYQEIKKGNQTKRRNWQLKGTSRSPVSSHLSSRT